ncbi:MAG: hypothetical protein KAU29_07095 [Gammaproteobacteria bacterium]|nr:hypothetical protein [Gammaproteobacteria bacterium]
MSRSIEESAVDGGLGKCAGGLGSRLVSPVENLAKKNQRVYLILSVAVAIAGYVYLLFSPAVVLTAFYFLHELIPAVENNQDWAVIGVISFIAILCMYASVRTVQLKFSHVKGLKLSKEMTPDLFDVITEVRSHFKRPSIKNIVITEKFECRIESVPRLGIPLASFNTLVIGLPMMQTLSPEEFRYELSRCIGQHSKTIPSLTLFVYKSHNLWSMYNESLSKYKKFGTSPLRWFFKTYSRLFEIIAAPAIRMEELEADLFALEYINEDEVFEALKSEAISRALLKTHYWPNIRSMVMKHPNIAIKPFANLENAVRTEALQNNRKKWLGEAYLTGQFPGDLMPSFRQRMEYIGHSKMRSIPVLGMNSAEKYLGDTRKNIIPIIDKLWRSTTLSHWVREYKEQRRDIGKIKDLSRKSQKNILWPKDIICYACLAKKLRGYTFRSSVNKLMRRNMRNATPEFISSRLQSQQRSNDIIQ